MAQRYRDMDLLHPDFRILADRLLTKCVEAGLMVMVIETWRSQEAHEEDLRKRRSWANRSKHQNAAIRQGENGLRSVPAALAIDVAPYEVYKLHGPDKLEWDAEDPVWQKIGEIGESLGMVWGGRWKMRDMGHFQAPWA